MRRPQGCRARLGGMLVAAVAALAMLALPGLASSHGSQHDHPGDAGTIQSFDPVSGVLTIDLADGGSVSGLVVPRTHIRCGHDRGHHHGFGHDLRRRGGPSASISHRGNDEDELEGENENEDHHGRGDEHGENPSGNDSTDPGSSEDPGQGAEHSARCTTDDLVAGATVRIAELILLDGKAFYSLVGLAESKPAPEETPTGG